MMLYIIIGLISLSIFLRYCRIYDQNSDDELWGYIVCCFMAILWPISWLMIFLCIIYLVWKSSKGGKL